jgi:hypothetical protein
MCSCVCDAAGAVLHNLPEANCDLSVLLRCSRC